MRNVYRSQLAGDTAFFMSKHPMGCQNQNFPNKTTGFHVSTGFPPPVPLLHQSFLSNSPFFQTFWVSDESVSTDEDTIGKTRCGPNHLICFPLVAIHSGLEARSCYHSVTGTVGWPFKIPWVSAKNFNGVPSVSCWPYNVACDVVRTDQILVSQTQP